MKEQKKALIPDTASAADETVSEKRRRQRLFTEDEVCAIIKGRLAKERKMLAKKWRKTNL